MFKFTRCIVGSVGYLTDGLISPGYLLVTVVGGALGSTVGARHVLKEDGGSLDIYVKLIVIGIMIFVSYDFLLSRLV